jgi:signal transduction histidine kinase
MKKVALVFVLAVVAPSLVLAWLALRSLRDEQLVLERQQTLLYQAVAENVARDVSDAVATGQQSFNEQVEQFLGQFPSNEWSYRFHPALRKSWPLAEVGFIVSLDGQVLAPSPFDGVEARQFRLENDRFLCNREAVEVYWSTPKGSIPQSKFDSKDKGAGTSKTGDGLKTKEPRTVAPEKDVSDDPVASKLAPEEAQFQRIVGDAREGTLARFLQDKLKLLFWYRPPRDPKLVFGALVDLNRLAEKLRGSVTVEKPLEEEVCVALLDDSGKPVALSQWDFRPDKARPLKSSRLPRDPFWAPRNYLKGFSIVGTNAIPKPPPASSSREVWKRPFVAAEVGEVLPHWEVAVYLLNPAKAGQAAAAARLTLGLLIGLLVLAIAIGSWLIAADLRRQLTLARQKTDFVSNVSHELKTPLTSIRMFSEMLAEGRVQDEDKRRHFLGIISAEAARLTRLINNVLDFARMERGEKKYEFTSFDFAVFARDTVESYRPHLEAAGFTLQTLFPSMPVLIRGDRDALAQVLVNLLSNAEKYSGERKEIQVELEVSGDGVEWRVLDRGLGVPRGCEENIFAQFYRAHDSLGSGIQGSGLGLTLARQIARAHGGDVIYNARDGGGSSFALQLPGLNQA